MTVNPYWWPQVGPIFGPILKLSRFSTAVAGVCGWPLTVEHLHGAALGLEVPRVPTHAGRAWVCPFTLFVPIAEPDADGMF